MYISIYMCEYIRVCVYIIFLSMAHFFSLPICNYISSKDQFRSLPKDSNVESTVKSAEIVRTTPNSPVWW